MVSSPPGSLVQRAPWCVALGLAAAVFLPGQAQARFELQDDAPPSVTYSIDGTAGNNGWYVSPSIVVHWSVTGSVTSTSGCEPANSIGDPDTGSTLTCTASGPGGTTTVTTKMLKVDATKPVASTATPARAPDKNGWYNHAVSIQWGGTDATSGVASCTSSTYTGPDSGSATTPGTCTDNAGNVSTPLAFGLSYDDSGPTNVTVTPARAPDHAGWYTHSVGLQWNGVDTVSGPVTCTTSTYNGPDNASASPSGSCTDQAGNTTTVSFPLSYDSSAPTGVAPSAARATDHGGWFNHGVGIAWTGNDPTSGISSCTSITYTGPDSATATASGTCTDKAGNTSAAISFGPFKYDDGLPTVSATPARGPDHAGWYNQPLGITWSGTDATSGIDSCTSLTYNGPDSANAGASGSCTDKAGNTAPLSFPLSYDDAAPTVTRAVAGRGPDVNGWYNHPVAVTWDGSDATSGIDSCTAITYSAPDVDGGSTSGTCTDRAGNTSAPLAFGLSYDDTPPTVTVAAARVPDDNGWYNHAVGISWSGTDATSGIASCSAPVTYSGPDSKNASSSGGCTDKAGNAGTPPPLSIKYDATPPVATAVPDRGSDSNGWYNHGLTIGWSSSDPVSGIASCTSTAYTGPDTDSATRTGTCTDGAGNTSAPVSFGFRFDATPPTGVSAGPARPPDHDGWYNRPLAVNWSGADALSGIASCSTTTYAGPTNSASAVSGSCTDQAGNTSSSVGYAFKYDSTPPAFKTLSLTPRDDAVALRWRTSGATDFRVTRKPGVGGSASSVVYDGHASSFADRKVDNYVRYTYAVTAEDDAGNILTRSAATTPMPMLFAPRPGARVSPGSEPLLAWRPVRKARYYNVQLWLGGHAVGSWWPTRPHLRLPARWKFGGSARALEAGAYTWYVWPGHGSRRLGRYGPLLGKSTFVVGSG